MKVQVSSVGILPGSQWCPVPMTAVSTDAEG